MQELPPYLVPHSSEDIAILYEDSDLLLVRKPTLLLSIPGRHPLAGSVVVPDPYYGGRDGFDHVLDLIEAACDGLMEHLRMRLHILNKK